MQRHVEQATLAARHHRGQPLYRRRHLAVAFDHAQAAGALGDEHAGFLLEAGKEGEAPGILETARHRCESQWLGGDVRGEQD